MGLASRPLRGAPSRKIVDLDDLHRKISTRAFTVLYNTITYRSHYKQSNVHTLALSLNVPISRLSSASVCEREFRIGQYVTRGRKGTDVEGCVSAVHGRHDERIMEWRLTLSALVVGGGKRERREPLDDASPVPLPSCTKVHAFLGR